MSYFVFANSFTITLKKYAILFSLTLIHRNQSLLFFVLAKDELGLTCTCSQCTCLFHVLVYYIPSTFSQNIPVPDDFFRFSRKYLEYSLVFQWKPGLFLMVASLEYTWPLTCACLEHSWSLSCAFLEHHRPLTCAWPWRTRPLPCAWRWQIWTCPCLGPTAPGLSLV
jgi:hypothetical protein